jgi:thiol-disulfide isomerase/thioredoxin
MSGALARPANSDAQAPPLLRTISSQFVLLRPMPLIPPLSISRADGTADSFEDLRGKVLLVNFWATWCPPCVREMPSLDYLEQQLRNYEFRTVAISMDRDGRVIEPFFQRHGISRLAPYVDNANRIGHFDTANVNGAPFSLYGLPITYILDRRGVAQGYITGLVDWQSPGAQKFLHYYIDQL